LPVFDIAACTALMNGLTELSARAAQTIREFGQSGLRDKADGSPVTAADEAAEAVICEGLARLAPGIPVISEEQASRENPDAAIVEGSHYFLVDPLDGTREFIAGRKEYTINIALIAGAAPILGIITGPAYELTWRGIVGHGADRIALADSKGLAPSAIRTRSRPDKPAVMVSRSHLDAQTEAYLVGVSHGMLLACGSSIKFCRLAEGSADLYPRLAPTHDWDIAAGHAILKAAGGHVTAPDGSPLVYGSADLLIPAFVASGDALMA
jgi:3'(2'), 5'-bisphosphate nucleotidase